MLEGVLLAEDEEEPVEAVETVELACPPWGCDFFRRRDAERRSTTAPDTRPLMAVEEVDGVDGVDEVEAGGGGGGGGGGPIGIGVSV